MTVAGLRGTGDFGTGERPQNFREYILWRMPYSEATLYGLLAKSGIGGNRKGINGTVIKTEEVDDPQFHWWSEGLSAVRLQVNGALDTTATTIVVDSTDPSANNPGIDRGTALNLKAGDLLQVETQINSTTYPTSVEILRVTGVTNATTFTVTRAIAGTAAAIADNTWLRLIGSAYPEGSTLPTATSQNPLKYTNYTQIFRDAYDITGTAAATYYRTGDVINNDKKRKMFRHAASIEEAILWGVASETTGANGKPLRTTGGLRSFIPSTNLTIFSTTVTYRTLMAAIEPAFTWTSEGAGDQRILLGGNVALLAIQNILANEAKAVINISSEVQKVYGLNFRRIVFPFGEGYLCSHPLLNRNAATSRSLFIIDMSALRWRYLKGRDTKSYENVNGLDTVGTDAKTGHWLTEGGLEVWHGGLTCGFLGNVVYP